MNCEEGPCPDIYVIQMMDRQADREKRTNTQPRAAASQSFHRKQGKLMYVGVTFQKWQFLNWGLYLPGKPLDTLSLQQKFNPQGATQDASYKRSSFLKWGDPPPPFSKDGFKSEREREHG